MRHSARQSDNNICFHFDALFTRETIADCLSCYPPRRFLVWFKHWTTITDGVCTLNAWVFRPFEARVAHILFRNHLWRFRHAASLFCICAFVRMLSMKEGDCNLVPRVFLRTLEETKDSGKIRWRANSDWVLWKQYKRPEVIPNQTKWRRVFAES